MINSQGAFLVSHDYSGLDILWNATAILGDSERVRNFANCLQRRVDLYDQLHAREQKPHLIPIKSRSQEWVALNRLYRAALRLAEQPDNKGRLDRFLNDVKRIRRVRSSARSRLAETLRIWRSYDPEKARQWRPMHRAHERPLLLAEAIKEIISCSTMLRGNQADYEKQSRAQALVFLWEEHFPDKHMGLGSGSHFARIAAILEEQYPESINKARYRRFMKK